MQVPEGEPPHGPRPPGEVSTAVPPDRQTDGQTTVHLEDYNFNFSSDLMFRIKSGHVEKLPIGLFYRSLFLVFWQVN